MRDGFQLPGDPVGRAVTGCGEEDAGVIGEEIEECAGGGLAVRDGACVRGGLAVRDGSDGRGGLGASVGGGLRACCDGLGGRDGACVRVGIPARAGPGRSDTLRLGGERQGGGVTGEGAGPGVGVPDPEERVGLPLDEQVGAERGPVVRGGPQ